MATDYQLAKDSTSSVVTLRRLSKDKTVRIRLAVASNHSTPKDALHEMASDSSPKVRIAVAQNDRTFAKTQMLLAQDENVQVRMTLAEDNGWYIADQKVRMLLANDEDPTVRKTFAVRYLREKDWSKDKDRGVRLVVASKSKDIATLSSFLNDEEPEVAKVAIRQLHEVVYSRATIRDETSDPWVKNENTNKTVTLNLNDLLAVLGSVETLVA